MKKLVTTFLALAAALILAAGVGTVHAQATAEPSAQSIKAVNALGNNSKLTTIQSTLSSPDLCNNPTRIISHMSTELDATGNAFISALIMRPSGNSLGSSVIICGFNTDGSFIGGTQVQIGARGRMFATTAAGSAPSLQQLLGNANLGNKAFQIWVKQVGSNATFTEYGYVGNSGQFLSFTPLISDTYSGFTTWSPNHVGADATYNTVVYLSNASATATTSFTMDLLSTDGLVVFSKTVGPVPPRGRATYAFSADLLAQNIPGFYSLNARSTTSGQWSPSRVIVYPTTGIGGIGVSVMPTY